MDFFKRKSTPSGLARLLFESALEDEKKPNSYRWEEKPEFKQDVYRKQMFVYLIASITYALGGFYSKYPRATEIQFELRHLAINEMKSRWGYSEEKTDNEMEEALVDYAKLLSATNPEENARISIEWTRNWARKMGVEETNFMTLVRIDQYWKSQFIFLAKFLKEVL